MGFSLLWSWSQNERFKFDDGKRECANLGPLDFSFKEKRKRKMRDLVTLRKKKIVFQIFFFKQELISSEPAEYALFEVHEHCHIMQSCLYSHWRHLSVFYTDAMCRDTPVTVIESVWVKTKMTLCFCTVLRFINLSTALYVSVNETMWLFFITYYSVCISLF